ACGSFTYNGQTYTQSGDYDVHFTTPVNCDSIVHLHLELGQNTYSTLNVDACDSYTWRGETYTQSGTYSRTLINSQGCDSICTLNLTISHDVASESTITACGSYDLNGETISTSGDYTRTYPLSNSCDSVVTYHINIMQPVDNQFVQLACGSFTWNGQTYYADGDYVQNFTTTSGCDSIVTMHLYLGTEDSNTLEQVACGSYTWNGQVYSESGQYTQTLQNIYGCDSVLTLNLTIYEPDNTSETMTACDSYEWHGTTYTESGSYQAIFQNQYGCDSTITLNLTIHSSSDIYEFDTISCGSVIWDGEEFSASGSYTKVFESINGCDSTVMMHLVYHEKIVDERDGNEYCTREYGNQVWMAENLRYLPQVDKLKSSTNPKYYVYGYTGTSVSGAKLAVNATIRDTTYQTLGVLYNWHAAITACPTGWHLPSSSEWEELFTYIENTPGFLSDTTSVACSLASQEYWAEGYDYNAVGLTPAKNNSSEFNGKPGGYCLINGAESATLQASSFQKITEQANWWTSTEESTAAYRIMFSNTSNIYDNSTIATHRAFSVRCVKDSDQEGD
ncbi:MAG: hypothetical protein HUK15_09535, partial [Bacteroidales bacterium]|nr:hypothetical protein [Bacteroidales bacterium]